MKKISMLLVSVLIILSFTGCNNKKTSEDFKKVDYDLKDLEYVKICDDESKCPVTATTYFGDMNYSTDIKELNDALNTINSDTKKYRQKTLNSKVDGTACKENIKYTYVVNSTFYQYTNDDFVTLGVVRNGYYICDDKNDPITTTSYIYDIKEGKMLTQEEFKKKIKLSDSKIKDAIDSSIKIMNEYDNTKYKIRDSYNDVVLVYDFSGNLYASYLLKEINKYMLAKIEI